MKEIQQTCWKDNRKTVTNATSKVPWRTWWLQFLNSLLRQGAQTMGISWYQWPHFLRRIIDILRGSRRGERWSRFQVNNHSLLPKASGSPHSIDAWLKGDICPVEEAEGCLPSPLRSCPKTHQISWTHRTEPTHHWRIKGLDGGPWGHVLQRMPKRKEGRARTNKVHFLSQYIKDTQP